MRLRTTKLAEHPIRNECVSRPPLHSAAVATCVLLLGCWEEVSNARVTVDVNSAPPLAVGSSPFELRGPAKVGAVPSVSHHRALSLEVCSPEARTGHVGACKSMGDSWFRIWGAQKSGKMPKALATDHRGQALYSSNMGSAGDDGVSIFATTPLGPGKAMPVSGSAVELWVSKDDRWLWTSIAEGWGRLRRYDTRTLQLEREFAVPGFPKWMVADVEENKVYASLWGLDGISQLNLERGDLRTLRTAPGKVDPRQSKNPRGMALSGDEQELYVANNHDHTLSVIDLQAWKESARVPIGYAPRHVVRESVTGTLYVSLTGEDAVVQWDPARRTELRRFKVGKRPKTIALSRDGRFLFVANFVGNSLSVVELSSGQVTELSLDLHKPSGLAVRADDRFVYVSGFCSNDVWAIERIDSGQTPTETLGLDRAYQPCLDCASTFAGCPFPRGQRPREDGHAAVKTDAEWGWERPKSRAGK